MRVSVTKIARQERGAPGELGRHKKDFLDELGEVAWHVLHLAKDALHIVKLGRGGKLRQRKIAKGC